MPTVTDIHFDGVPPSASISAAIRKRWRELDMLRSGLVHGGVTVSSACGVTADSVRYLVEVCMQLPDRTVVRAEARRSSACRDALTAVHDAFDIANQLLAACVHEHRAQDSYVRGRPAFSTWKETTAVPA